MAVCRSVLRVPNFYTNDDTDKIHSCDNVLVRCRSFRNRQWRNSRVSFLVVASYCWRLSANATDIGLSSSSSNINGSHSQASTSNAVEIPVTCYQIIGVSNQAEKDEIVKSVMHLKNIEIEEGYSTDASVSRQNILMDTRDKLLFEPEYAGNIKENIPPKSPIRIPWAWLPGVLCLLQEVGEEKLVLDIGQRALQHPNSKPYIHDLLLCMALAECAIAKVSLEKRKISQGFEALARAQCLLRRKSSLENMALLSQIEKSLEELAPACTLELLGMPHAPENAERRSGAISALHELLRQGLDVENSCHVQDWPCFLNQALHKLMAVEIVELLPWDNLALTRKNKKSIVSQNQRVVIDFNCFYMVLIAHIAVGFSSKQIDLVDKARLICECLIASEGVDLKFELAFCLFLLRQGDEQGAVESLQRLQKNPRPGSWNSKLSKETESFSDADKSLEIWLKEAVLDVFPDMRQCSPSLVNFFSGGKRVSGNRQHRRDQQPTLNVNHRPLASVLAQEQKAVEESASYTNSTQSMGQAVRKLASPKLQGPLKMDMSGNFNNSTTPSMQLKRSLGTHQDKIWDVWLDFNNMIGKVIFVTVLGCFLFASSRLFNMHLWRMRNESGLGSNKPRTTGSPSWISESSLEERFGPENIKGSSFTRKLKKFLSTLIMQVRQHSEAADLRSFYVTSILPSYTAAAFKEPMSLEEAETLIKKWQAIKAEALGPNHHVDGLFNVLDGSMLVQWRALADTAKARSCFWRFLLLQLSVLRADILTDGTGKELAKIEAILEEAAELVDESQPKHPNYYSTYKIHYVLRRNDNGLWKFYEGEIQTP